jgi:carbon storage regulator
MLVLSRYIDEEIRIGDDIRIVITDIRGDRVRIGIEAPEGVPVHRKEVYEAIRAGHKPAKTTVASSNSVINSRTVVATRKEVVSMT